MTEDGAKEWVTVKVPLEDKERSKDYRPEGVTFGDCLVAGAERLNDHLDSDPPPGADVTATITPELDEEALEEIRERLEQVAAGAVATGAAKAAEAEVSDDA